MFAAAGPAIVAVLLVGTPVRALANESQASPDAAPGRPPDGGREAAAHGKPVAAAPTATPSRQLTPSVEDTELEQDRMFQFVEPTMTLPVGEVEALYRLNHEVEGEHGNTSARYENRVGIEAALFLDRLTGELFANALQREDTSDPFTLTSMTAGLRYRLFRPGAFWVDAAVLLEYQPGFQGHGSVLESRLTLSKDIRRFVCLANIGIESGKESGSGKVGDSVEGSFAVGVAYRILPRLSLAVEGTRSYAGGTLGVAVGPLMLALSAGTSLETSVRSSLPPFRVGMTLRF